MVIKHDKKAIFLDKNRNIQTAVIRYVPNEILWIDSYNKEQQKTGYINLYFHPNKRIFLDVIYCYDEFRGNGIATQLSDLADYFLKDYSGYMIRGVYEPSQLSIDRENSIVKSQEELNLRATNFYHSSDFSIVSLKDYQKKPSSYPNIDIRNDFQLGEELANYIVVKKITPKHNYHFTEIDGILVSDNALNINLEQEKYDIENYCQSKKSLKLRKTVSS